MPRRYAKSGGKTWKERYATEPDFRAHHLATVTKWRDAHRVLANKQQREYVNEHKAVIRSELLEAYGGRCQCCGDQEPKFLTLDHANKDGAEHRRQLGAAGINLHRKLRQAGWPQDLGLRLLCWNCHMAEDLLGGCPHAAK